MRSIQRQNLDNEIVEKLGKFIAQKLEADPYVTSPEIAKLFPAYDPDLATRGGAETYGELIEDLSGELLKNASDALKDLKKRGPGQMIIPGVLKGHEIPGVIDFKIKYNRTAWAASYKATLPQLESHGKVRHRVAEDAVSYDENFQFILIIVRPIMLHLGPGCTLQQALAFLKGMEGGESGRPN